ncbi:MAG: tetratricopeptide repeat protein [Candidatus Omnitrophica bacterium]|nr:tetratricopeptide repeat protein [Candidatus Omnitrophota bacterium]
MALKPGVIKIGVFVLFLSFSAFENGNAENPGKEALDKGTQLAQSEKYDEAIAEFNKVIARDPNNVAAYVALGNAYKQKKEVEKALATYTQGLEIAKDDRRTTDLYKERADAYLRAGWSGKGDKNFELAIADLNKAEPFQSKNGWHFQRKGWAYSGAKNYKQAAIEFQKAAELLPPQSKAHAYFGRGKDYAAQNRFGEALSDFNKAIELEPKFAEAYHERGLVHAQKGEYALAVSDYTKAIECNPDFGKAYLNRSMASFQKKDYAEALSDVRKAKKRKERVNPGFLAALEKAANQKA